METILVERGDGDEGVVTVTLNRPEKRNALNPQMAFELLETFRSDRGATRRPGAGAHRRR